ncbi:MAG: di-heme oxidoredictase family protein [Myxococcota bacterium]
MTRTRPEILVVLALAGCYAGVVTDNLSVVDARDLSGIAGPSSLDRRPVDFAPRDTFATENTLASLSYSTSSVQDSETINAVFDRDDTSSGISIFTNLHDREDERVAPGLGPVMNQLSCVGCHRSTEILHDFVDPADLENLVSTDNFRNATPAARAHRIAPPEDTVGQLLTIEDERNVETAAFTLFGDFNDFDGHFEGLSIFGGPVFHVRATEGCHPDFIVPEAQDPFLVGPQVHRVMGERAGPPYIGRGLMEAVYAGDITADEDPTDSRNDFGSEQPAVRLPPFGNPSCEADCISGRQNQSRPSEGFVGGEPVVRLGRFGLRAAGPTIIQFVVGGTQGELGFTSLLRPTEPSNALNTSPECVDEGPDPELSVGQLRGLRDMIRMVAPPRPAGELLGDAGADAALQADVEAGARLFGLDLDAFRERMLGEVATDANLPRSTTRARATDRQLNCVGCHTPILPTGASPAATDEIAEALSQRWAPLFSDLLIHDMGGFPPGYDAAQFVEDNEQWQGLGRNLADFALPGQGLARGNEWRTPPLMGIGKIGPPFMHDARVYLNQVDPQFYFAHNADLDAAGVPVSDRITPIDTFDEALIAAIEIHDFPTPADTDGDGVPNYELCPADGDAADFCVRDSEFRSEARLVIEKWRALTREEQEQVTAFLKSL